MCDKICKNGYIYMHGPRNKQLTILTSEAIKAKIKGYAALSNVDLGIFVNRILIEKIQKIEKGEDKFIKLEEKEKKK